MNKEQVIEMLKKRNEIIAVLNLIDSNIDEKMDDEGISAKDAVVKMEKEYQLVKGGFAIEEVSPGVLEINEMIPIDSEDVLDVTDIFLMNFADAIENETEFNVLIDDIKDKLMVKVEEEL